MIFNFAKKLHKFITALLKYEDVSAYKQQLLQERKIKNKELLLAKNRYEMIFKNNAAGIYLVDEERNVVSVNTRICEIFGYTEDELIGHNFAMLHVNQKGYENFANYYISIESELKIKVEYQLKRKDGRVIWCELLGKSIALEDDKKIFLWSILDIDERKKAEEENHHLRQLYAALSQCNHAIVYSNNEKELFEQICKDTAHFSGIKMAWVGLANEERTAIYPIAFSGEGTHFLDNLVVSLSLETQAGQGPAALAFREDRAIWIQNFEADAMTKPWRNLAKQFNWKSLGVLPLHQQGVVIGVFILYADTINMFSETVRELLVGMVRDIDYALDGYQKDATLVATWNKYKTILDVLPDLMFELGLDGKYYDCYSPRTELLAAPPSDLIGKKVADVLSPKAAQICLSALQEANQIGFSKGSIIEIELPQAKAWFELSIARKALQEGDEQPKFVVLSRDVTNRMLAEEKLHQLSQAVEQSSSSIVITDLQGNIVYVNSAFVKITGYLLEEVLGKNPRILNSGRTPASAYTDMWAHLEQGKSWKGEFINRRKDGTEYVELVNISPIFQVDGTVTHYMAIKEDITDRKDAEERIYQLANFDHLTGLPTRLRLEEDFRYMLSLAKRSQTSFAVMFLDLDHFKEINDTLGHNIGDALLIEVARRLQSLMREADIVSRLGGDEFIIVLPETDMQGSQCVAKKLLDVISSPYYVDDYELNVTVSIGISLYPSDGLDMKVLSKNADAAMYQAKAQGRNSYCFFTASMQARSLYNLQLSNALRHAIDRDELQVHYQPQISLKDGRIVGAEALLRWYHPEYGYIPPHEFIPVAEESGQIMAIGEWVLRTTAKQAKEWVDEGFSQMVFAVNLSAYQFKHPSLPGLITQILFETGLSSEYLELELTESMAMLDPQSAIGIIERLHACGIHLSIDDFGTGYSSLNYLKKFKAYKLKIDQSFVADICNDADDRAIVKAIIMIAKSLGMKTIAEGVESEEQLSYLQQEGCDEVQGYYYSKPLAAGIFKNFLKEKYTKGNR